MNKKDSAYDDLLSSINKEINTPKASGGFKVNIDGLENEFNTGSSERYNKAQKYRKMDEPVKKRPTADIQRKAPAKRPAAPVRGQAAAPNVQRKPYSGVNGNTQRTAGGKRPGANVVKKNTAKKKVNFRTLLKNSKTAVITVFICAIVSVLISSYAISCMNDILAIKRDSENIVTVNIPSDIDTKQAIDILKDNKLIKHKYFCLLYAKLVKYRDDNYLTGIYNLTPSLGLENMLSAFKESPVSGETVTLSFPEGYTVIQIAEKLEKYEVCSSKVFYATIRDVDFSSEYSFIKEEKNKSDRFQILEGYLYPDTYEFFKGENAASVVRKFLDNFKKKWTDKYDAQAKKMNMSIDEIIALASIIEKEAYGSDQMPLVSSVFHNRLNKSGIFPTLQSNATSDYVNDYISKQVTDSSQLTQYMRNYSTYKCEGLPVGAICNPGDAAINAALYPKDTNYYFFLHDNNKKLYLAATDAEHKANSIEALKANSSKKED